MKLVALMPCRNSDWILGLSLRAVLLWADEVVVMLHCCTDRSEEIALAIAREYHPRVMVMADENPVWEEMRHRQALLDIARESGATHIAMVDDDEVLTGNLLPSIRETIERMPAGRILQLPWVCLARGIDRYYSSGIWFNNWVSCAFEDTPSAHWQARNGYDFHHRHPMGIPCLEWMPVNQQPVHQGGLMHLQFVSERRLKAKQYAYQLVERSRWPTREPVEMVRQRYSPAIYQSDPALIPTQPVDPSWWSPYADLMEHLHIDCEPWQERLCREILSENPGIERGLDDFGLRL